MFVLIHHEVSEPATFWSIISEEIEHLPAGTQLLLSLPNHHATVEFSLWTAESLESLQRWVDERVRDVSRNTFYPIEAANAFGLEFATPPAAARASGR